jgi:hypothetical protein
MARMWWLVDYRVVQITDEKGYFSRVQHTEFDCRRRRSRLLSVALMTEQMGGGQAVFEDVLPRRWQPIANQPFQKALWDIACAG